MPDPKQWPDAIVTKPSAQTKSETKLIKEVFVAGVETMDVFEEMLAKHSFWTTLRIMAWITRFLNNSKLKKPQRVMGPLTTIELNQETEWWIKRVQRSYHETEQFEDKLRLNLQLNSNGLYECRGRIQGSFPLYIPPKSVLSQKMLEDAHIVTLVSQ